MMLIPQSRLLKSSNLPLRSHGVGFPGVEQGHF